MKSPIILAASFAAAVAAAPTEELGNASSSAKLYLTGDSTMAIGGGGGPTQGWGQYLQYSFGSLTVVNDAHAGTSARSFTTQGRFASVISAVKPGDYVLIEFGHNDGGVPSATDNGRPDCPGAGNETCKGPAGAVVQTFSTYITDAARAMIAKGAHVVISSQTPDNPWETGKFIYGAGRFVDYAKAAAASLGGTTAYVDHGQYVANEFQALGLKAVDAFYPMDHTHTSPEGANVVSAAFVKGLLCGKSALAGFVKNTTASIAGSCI